MPRSIINLLRASALLANALAEAAAEFGTEFAGNLATSPVAAPPPPIAAPTLGGSGLINPDVCQPEPEAEDNIPGLTAESTDDKPKRHRRTKAEMEAARQAEAAANTPQLPMTETLPTAPKPAPEKTAESTKGQKMDKDQLQAYFWPIVKDCDESNKRAIRAIISKYGSGLLELAEKDSETQDKFRADIDELKAKLGLATAPEKEDNYD